MIYNNNIMSIKVGIIIAFHIYYDKQIKYLTKCLKSLIYQSNKANIILVSISFDNEFYKKIFSKNFLRKFRR